MGSSEHCAISFRIVEPQNADPKISVTLRFDFDPTDKESVERLARTLHELIHEDERGKFLADFRAAAAAAGIDTTGPVIS